MPTEAVESPIEGVRIWRPQVHGDARGRFVEVFRSAAVPEPMAQSNHSRSEAGVLRGSSLYGSNEAGDMDREQEKLSAAEWARAGSSQGAQASAGSR